MIKRYRAAAVRSPIVELKGGINENNSSLFLKPGELIDGLNYMLAQGMDGGYTSTKGYERFDGIYRPSTYESSVFTLHQGDAAVYQGDTIQGATATAVALADAVLISGTYGVDAVAEVEVRDITGSFVGDEAITVGATAVGTLFNKVNIVGATPEYFSGTEYARGLVSEVPGTGPILGLAVYKGEAYAFRKHATLAEIRIYKEDATGWLEVVQAAPLAYSSDHLFRFDYGTFNGVYYMFLCDGTQEARAYDGTTVTVINNSAMAPNDKPIHILVTNNYLWLAYRGGSLQVGDLGDPFSWAVPFELLMNSEIEDLKLGVKSSVIIGLEQGVNVISGSVRADFENQVFTRDAGVYKSSMENILGTILFVGERGVTSMDAVQEFGDYQANTMSERFKETMESKKGSLQSVMVSKELNQYRLFFNDNTAIYMSFESKELKGSTIMQFPKMVATVATGEDKSLKEYNIFSDGEDNGYVYRMDSGHNFDGSEIICRATTAFYHYSTPTVYKQLIGVEMEIAGENGQEFNIQANFDYLEPNQPTTIWVSGDLNSFIGTAIWGTSVWGTMRYGQAVTATNRISLYLQGVGTKISYKIITEDKYRSPHTLQNIITNYKRMARRV